MGSHGPVRYHVISNDGDRRARWAAELAEAGHDVVEEYDTGAVIVTVGGDGTILYAARNYADPTILPARAGDSVGHRTHLEAEQLPEAVERIESGREGETYAVVEHPTLAASRDGDELGGRFRALNEIGLHHASPTLAADFAVRIDDGGRTLEYDRVVGDGVLVATPFGSTAYYRSITGGTFEAGLGVAFNNVHTPTDAPGHVGLSADAVVELEVLEADHASETVLVRDNDPESHELAAGETVEIRRAGESVELLRPLW